MKIINLILIVILFSSCAAPYMVVQYVNEDKSLCRNSKGAEVYLDNNEVPMSKGDTLIHVGNFNYYNINALN